MDPIETRTPVWMLYRFYQAFQNMGNTEPQDNAHENTDMCEFIHGGNFGFLKIGSFFSSSKKTGFFIFSANIFACSIWAIKSYAEVYK